MQGTSECHGLHLITSERKKTRQLTSYGISSYFLSLSLSIYRPLPSLTCPTSPFQGWLTRPVPKPMPSSAGFDPAT